MSKCARDKRLKYASLGLLWKYLLEQNGRDENQQHTNKRRHIEDLAIEPDNSVYSIQASHVVFGLENAKESNEAHIREGRQVPPSLL